MRRRQVETEALARVAVLERERYDNLDKKLDAIHVSLKEDLTEIRVETRLTNGAVTTHTKSISKIEGGILVLAAGLPVVTGLVVFAVEKILGH